MYNLCTRKPQNTSATELFMKTRQGKLVKERRATTHARDLPLLLVCRQVLFILVQHVYGFAIM